MHQKAARKLLCMMLLNTMFFEGREWTYTLYERIDQ